MAEPQIPASDEPQNRKPQPSRGSEDPTIDAPREDVPAPQIKIRGYTIIREISRGGQAVVFQAIQESIGRKVAIKVLHEGPFVTASKRARFEREIQVLAALNHPNIVSIIDRGVTEAGNLFLVMDYIEGVPLEEYLEAYTQRHKGEPPSPDEMLRLFLKICDGVNAAHLRGVVHRDLKPSNIRIDGRREPHILDFGIAAVALPPTGATPTPVTVTGQFIGSLPWASPEQAEGLPEKIDIRSDVYSLGVILYQLLTGGHFPYPVTGSMPTILSNITSAEPAPPSQVLEDTAAEAARKAGRRRRRFRRRKTINETVEAIVMKALSKSPQERYQSAGDLARDIGNYLSGLPTIAAGVATLKRERRGRRIRAVAIAGVALLACCLGAILMWNYLPQRGDTPPVAGTAPAVNPTTPSTPPAAAASADDAFVKEVAALAPEQQIARVVAKLKELNPGYDGQEEHRIVDGNVDELSFSAVGVTDISPVRALAQLKRLGCTGTYPQVGPLSDISPLRGLNLRHCNLSFTQVADLSALSGMAQLNSLMIKGTKIQDLSPLKGMALIGVDCSLTPVADLAPLAGMPLTRLFVDFKPERDTAVLRSIKTLEQINGVPIAEFWKQVDAGKTPSVTAGSSTPGGATDAFIKEVAALPPEQQVARVVAKLKELNPGYDGQEEHKIENGQVVELSFSTVAVADIAPVRALSGLKKLTCEGEKKVSGGGAELRKGLLADLSPLRGLNLGTLRCNYNRIVDLGPLTGMPLIYFSSYFNYISDLRPLASTPLRNLSLSGNNISDLSPLKGMALTQLMCNEPRVKDLSPLVGMPLKNLTLDAASVSDLSPLHGLSLETIYLSNAPASTELLRSIKTLKTINNLPAAEFWKQVAEGKTPNASANDAFIKEVAALPAEQQIARVVAKLKELNPGYDGQEEHKVENGRVVELSFSTVAVADIAPVRALSGLRKLSCEGEKSPDGGVKRKGLLTDLSPLRGLKLEELVCSRNNISDLSPLTGLPLQSLTCYHNYVSDLSPLAGMPLRNLSFSGNKIGDLSPLKGMPLDLLMCNEPQVKDLSPLAGVPLRRLIIGRTSVSDLSPLRGMLLEEINLGRSPVSDLSPLAGMPLKSLKIETPVDLTPLRGMPLTELVCVFMPQRIPAELLRSIKTLKTINNLPAAEFWKQVAEGKTPNASAPAAAQPNTLSDAEKAAGWKLLFDGKSLDGWQPWQGGPAAPEAWAVEDGAIATVGKGRSILATADTFGDFELAFEWKVSPQAISGVFYHTPKDGQGFLYIVLDNDGNPDGQKAQTRAASLYAILAPQNDVTKPVGEYNEGRIVCRRTKVEHWLNGRKVLEYDTQNDAWRKAIQKADDSIKNLPSGQTQTGHITLLGKGTKVWYRSIKVRPLGGAAASSAWAPLDIAAACTADIISTDSHKAANQFTFNGSTVASASWLRKNGLEDPGIPDDGRVPLPDAERPAFFHVLMPPARNAILISGPEGQQPKPVLLELAANERRRYAELAILYATCWGNGTLYATLRYETGAETTVTLPVFDWSSDDRIAQLPADVHVSATTRDTRPQFGKPFGKRGDLLSQRTPADPQRTLYSLTFSFGSCTPSKGYTEQDARPRFTVGVFAVSAMPASAPGAPPSKVGGIDDAFLKEVASLAPEQQVARVVAKMKQLNPGYDGQEEHKIVGGRVVEFKCSGEAVSDISPLRALPQLTLLWVYGSRDKRSPLADLSPLRGMTLSHLSLFCTQVSDLAPLEGMPLRWLNLDESKVSNLAPLRGMSLNHLTVGATPVTDLSVLRDILTLDTVRLYKTVVVDLAPLRGLLLKELACQGTQVRDLSPLEGMPLKILGCNATKVVDLSPLRALPLERLSCDFKPERDTELLRSIKTLDVINNLPAAEFWKRAAEGKAPIATAEPPINQRSP
jgi:serine/threonine protein kinase/Leucine-rich repeat (LRR) protein